MRGSHKPWLLRKVKYRDEGPAAADDAGAHRDGVVKEHGEFVSAFTGVLFPQARDAFSRLGPVAVCVPFADLSAALQGQDLRVTIMDREKVLNAVARADPDRSSSIREMLDSYNPGEQFNLILFDDAGDLYPYRVDVEERTASDDDDDDGEPGVGDPGGE